MFLRNLKNWFFGILTIHNWTFVCLECKTGSLKCACVLLQHSRAASQTICDGGTATHTGRESKNSLALEWTAPTALKSASTVDFTVTVLQSQRIYWLKHSGSTLLEVQPTSAEIVEPVPSTKPEPTPESEPSPEPGLFKFILFAFGKLYTYARKRGTS